MKILMVSLDKDLLKADSQVTRRLNLYADSFKGEIHIILHTTGGAKPVVNGKLHIYPTNSSFKTKFVLDAYSLGKKIAKKVNPDLIVTQDVHATGLAGAFLKKKLGLPLCSHIHGDGFNNPVFVNQSILFRVFNVIAKYVLRRVDGVRVVSDLIKRRLIEFGVDKKILVQSTPIDLDFFYKRNKKEEQAFRKKFKLKNEKYVFFVGRFVFAKNLFFMADLFKSIDATLLIAGSGPLGPKLKEHIKKNNIKNIRFLGHLSYDELKSAYYNIDLVILPSVFEGVAKVLKEASACGIPCVSSDVSGAVDIVENGKTGYVLEVNNREAFVESINKLVKDDKLRKKFGEAALKKIKKEENEERGIKRVANFWKEIANE